MLPPPGVAPSNAIDDAFSTIATAVTTTLAVTLPTLEAALAHHRPPPPPNDTGECELLGPFAIFVQGFLGIAALLALVFKRYRERPQRPLKIWFFDVSKQIFGGVCVHVANLLMSMLSSGKLSIRADPGTVAGMAKGDMGQRLRRVVGARDAYVPNPCSFYLLNLAIDTTIGIPILLFFLHLFTRLFALTNFGTPRESIESGHYGHPPKSWWWFKQSVIYFLGLMAMKICVLFIFLAVPFISRAGDWVLSWTYGNETLQIVFVMLIFPVMMNALQYYIIDSFIMNKGENRTPVADDEAENEGLQNDDDYDSDEEASSEHDLLAKKEAKHVPLNTDSISPRTSERKGSVQSPLRRAHGDYDPATDGESSPVVGSTSGSERDRPVHRSSVGEAED